ncbi:hypothetical protein J6590_064732 [Homalodisca vitripennis]|nr:hypothetical protein J6590_064732 [Homalodisca vitripennis]
MDGGVAPAWESVLGNTKVVVVQPILRLAQRCSHKYRSSSERHRAEGMIEGMGWRGTECDIRLWLQLSKCVPFSMLLCAQ